jgi:hypothetical protein
MRRTSMRAPSPSVTLNRTRPYNEPLLQVAVSPWSIVSMRREGEGAEAKAIAGEKEGRETKKEEEAENRSTTLQRAFEIPGAAGVVVVLRPHLDGPCSSTKIQTMKERARMCQRSCDPNEEDMHFSLPLLTAIVARVNLDETLTHSLALPRKNVEHQGTHVVS